MTMKMDEFSNGIRILFNVDYEEFVASIARWDDYIGPDDMLQEKWERFRANPIRYFLAADDGTQSRIWQIIKTRNARRKAA